MALISGLLNRKLNSFARQKSSALNPRFKWPSIQPKSTPCYTESTTRVGDVVLHEVQEVNPQSMKSVSKSTNSPVTEKVKRRKKSEIAQSELLAPVMPRKRGRPRKVVSVNLEDKNVDRQDSPAISNQVSEEEFNLNLFQGFPSTPQVPEVEYDNTPV